MVFMFWKSWNLIQGAHRKELKMNAHSHAWSSQFLYYSVFCYSTTVTLAHTQTLRIH